MKMERKILEILYKYQNSKRNKKLNKSKSRGSTSGLTAGEIAGRIGTSIEKVMDIIIVLKRKEKIKSVKEKYWVLG